MSSGLLSFSGPPNEEVLEAKQVEPPERPRGQPETFFFSSDHKESFSGRNMTTFSFVLNLSSGHPITDYYSRRQLEKYTKFYFVKEGSKLSKFDGVYKTRVLIQDRVARVDFEFPSTVGKSNLSFCPANEAHCLVEYAQPGR
ncbi:hypothetical protein AAMO2058_000158600 [Amorphochlora amoebiformis]